MKKKMDKEIKGYQNGGYAILKLLEKKIVDLKMVSANDVLKFVTATLKAMRHISLRDLEAEWKANNQEAGKE